MSQLEAHKKPYGIQWQLSQYLFIQSMNIISYYFDFKQLAGISSSPEVSLSKLAAAVTAVQTDRSKPLTLLAMVVHWTMYHNGLVA